MSFEAEMREIVEKEKTLLLLSDESERKQELEEVVSLWTKFRERVDSASTGDSISCDSLSEYSDGYETAVEDDFNTLGGEVAYEGFVSKFAEAFTTICFDEGLELVLAFEKEALRLGSIVLASTVNNDFFEECRRMGAITTEPFISLLLREGTIGDNDLEGQFDSLELNCSAYSVEDSVDSNSLAETDEDNCITIYPLPIEEEYVPLKQRKASVFKRAKRKVSKRFSSIFKRNRRGKYRGAVVPRKRTGSMKKACKSAMEAVTKAFQERFRNFVVVQ